MTRRDYIVDMRCPKCGKVHRVASHFRLDGGPTEPGSLADLYGDGELPPALVSLRDDLVCMNCLEVLFRAKYLQKVDSGCVRANSRT